MSTALPAGVSIRALPRFEDARGVLLPMLRADDPGFARFGEIYFSGVYEGAVKAWRRHHLSTSNLAVPIGRIRLVLFDARTGSATEGQLSEIEIGGSQYDLVTVPPGLWTGWQGLAPGLSLMANCATLPHDPAAVESLDPASPVVPYQWSRR